MQERRVQKKATTAAQTSDVHAAAAHGTQGGGGPLPYADRIQAAFGRHDISHVQAYVGGTAREGAEAMGAEAYATGSKIAFREQPSLRTAAHEAAHVIQQQAGVQLSGGVGAVGDRYEQHADQVADAVVQGRSVEGELDRFGGSAPKSADPRDATQQSRRHTSVGETAARPVQLDRPRGRSRNGSQPRSDATSPSNLVGMGALESSLSRVTAGQLTEVISELERLVREHAGDLTSTAVAVPLPPPLAPVVLDSGELAAALERVRALRSASPSPGTLSTTTPAGPVQGPAGQNPTTTPSGPVSEEPTTPAETADASSAVTAVINLANATIDDYGIYLRANWTPYIAATSASGSVPFDENDVSEKLRDKLVDHLGELGGEALRALQISSGIVGYLVSRAITRGVEALWASIVGQPASPEDRARDAAANEFERRTQQANHSIDAQIRALRNDVAARNHEYSNAVTNGVVPQQDRFLAHLSREHVRFARIRASLHVVERVGPDGTQTPVCEDSGLGQSLIRQWTMANANGAHEARQGVDQHRWEGAARRGLPGESGIEGHAEAWVFQVRAHFVGLGFASDAVGDLEREVHAVVRRTSGDSNAQATAVVTAFQDSYRQLPQPPAGVSAQIVGRPAGWYDIAAQPHTLHAQSGGRGIPNLRFRVALRADAGAVVLDRARYRQGIEVASGPNLVYFRTA